jgi:hypothetical protein
MVMSTEGKEKKGIRGRIMKKHFVSSQFGILFKGESWFTKGNYPQLSRRFHSTNPKIHAITSQSH